MMERQSVSDQAASYLRRELKRKRWTGSMPGRDKLALELGVHGSTAIRKRMIRMHMDFLLLLLNAEECPWRLGQRSRDSK